MCRRVRVASLLAHSVQLLCLVSPVPNRVELVPCSNRLVSKVLSGNRSTLMSVPTNSRRLLTLKGLPKLLTTCRVNFVVSIGRG